MDHTDDQGGQDCITTDVWSVAAEITSDIYENSRGNFASAGCDDIPETFCTDVTAIDMHNRSAGSSNILRWKLYLRLLVTQYSDCISDGKYTEYNLF